VPIVSRHAELKIIRGYKKTARSGNEILGWPPRGGPGVGRREVTRHAVLVPKNFDNDYRVRRDHCIVILDRRLSYRHSRSEVIIELFSFSLLTPFFFELPKLFELPKFFEVSEFSEAAEDFRSCRSFRICRSFRSFSELSKFFGFAELPKFSKISEVAEVFRIWRSFRIYRVAGVFEVFRSCRSFFLDLPSCQLAKGPQPKAESLISKIYFLRITKNSIQIFFK
jgi:hypothetical protein